MTVKTNTKCIILLSEKSSGSSAVQQFLAKYAEIKHISKTRHYQYETLYWTKAASVLELPQLNMIDSEVPISKNKAIADLNDLFTDNISTEAPVNWNKDSILEGWRSICKEFAPIFFEKSPHHLFQKSSLDLISEAITELNDIDFIIIGLIRNPMDTIYSQYLRWKSNPEKIESQWRIAYQNLLAFKAKWKEKVFITRYEDIVQSEESLYPILAFCLNKDISEIEIESDYLHSNSVQKWKSDKIFGHLLSKETKDLAKNFGYKDNELQNEPHIFWPIIKVYKRATYKLINLGKSNIKLINKARI